MSAALVLPADLLDSCQGQRVLVRLCDANELEGVLLQTTSCGDLVLGDATFSRAVQAEHKHMKMNSVATYDTVVIRAQHIHITIPRAT